MVRKHLAKDKKGVELTVNTMIIIVLVLLVLLVLAFILTGGFKNWFTSTSCEGMQGSCRAACNADERPGGIGGCKTETPICCVKTAGVGG